MSRKLITVTTLILTIGFLLLGTIYKTTADGYKGMTARDGIMVDGKFQELSTFNFGGNSQKYESFNTGGTICYILGSITGVICVISFITGKKSKH